MNSLNEFLNNTYGGQSNWFVEYVNEYSNQMRIMDIVNKKEYLSGVHAINKRENEKFNNKIFEPRRIILQYAKQLLAFQTSYLVGNP